MKTPLIDFKRSIRVRVDQDAIDQSMRKSSAHCMIATAIKRQYPRLRNIVVNITQIGMTDPKTGVRSLFLTPRIAQIALLNYDWGKAVEPFKFQAKDPVVRLWKKHSRSDRKGRKKVYKRLHPTKSRELQPGTLRAKYSIGQRREFGLNAMGRVEAMKFDEDMNPIRKVS
jgi:hypothetical protein